MIQQILSHLELHWGKHERKKLGPSAKNTAQDNLPQAAAPQMDLFGDF